MYDETTNNSPAEAPDSPVESPEVIVGIDRGEWQNSAPVITQINYTGAQRRIIETVGKGDDKIELDPYADIDKEETLSERTGVHTGYAIMEHQYNKDGFLEWQHAGNVGKDYMIVKNKELEDLAYQIIDRSGLSFEQDMVWYKNKRFKLTFSMTDESLMVPASPRVGDLMGFGLLFENSYDGSIAARVSAYLYFLVCGNGAICSKEFRAIRFRHLYANSDWQEDVKKAMEIINYMPGKLNKFATRLQQLQNMPANQAFFRMLREEGGPASKVNDGLWRSIFDHWWAHEEDTAYGFFNACTNQLWNRTDLNTTHMKRNDEIVTGLLYD